ncbi:hypothetical protein BRADI_1g32031v3 [Brachypodium distachyon]|uniref:Uncharacterized protein n=1 Tax=Brachypodium distachyon TaxID=15368 RepID=A0A2K2DMA2_BRADI|nr:hypothetical protein BRADI_1g32031v3 [Brachypodium distachyon]
MACTLIALLERLGNALGTLAFIWATVVVLGGFSEHLGDDFWVATAIVFLESFRLFPTSSQSSGLIGDATGGGSGGGHDRGTAGTTRCPSSPHAETDRRGRGRRRRRCSAGRQRRPGAERGGRSKAGGGDAAAARASATAQCRAAAGKARASGGATELEARRRGAGRRRPGAARRPATSTDGTGGQRERRRAEGGERMQKWNRSLQERGLDGFI